jgi:hypothetical protein
MKKIFCTVVFLCLVSTALTSVGYAQHGEGDPQGPRGREKVDQLRKMKLIETLGLDEEKSVRFISRFSKHQEHIRALYLERGTMIDNLEEAIKESRESEYSKLIEGMFSIERKILDERIDFIKNLDDLLSKKQQAKFLVFERNFNRDLRDMIFDAKRGPGRER